MKGLLLTLSWIVLLIPDPQPVQAQQNEATVFIIVRHAERADDGLEERMENPGLSDEGLERAARLVKILERQAVDAVFSTDVKRTRMTVALVAASNGVPVETYDWQQQEAFLRQLAESRKGETILIAGHSNTIDTAANLLLGEDYFSEKFDHEDYGNLLIVTSERFGQGRVIHLAY